MEEISQVALKWIWIGLIWLHIALALLLGIAKLLQRLGFLRHPSRGGGLATFLHNFL